MTAPAPLVLAPTGLHEATQSVIDARYRAFAAYARRRCDYSLGVFAYVLMRPQSEEAPQLLAMLRNGASNRDVYCFLAPYLAAAEEVLAASGPLRARYEAGYLADAKTRF